eukprot:COSAG01_NODE_8969_length_2599_cov_1.883600_2_plen_117_part_00
MLFTPFGRLPRSEGAQRNSAPAVDAAAADADDSDADDSDEVGGGGSGDAESWSEQEREEGGGAHGGGALLSPVHDRWEALEKANVWVDVVELERLPAVQAAALGGGGGGESFLRVY